MEYSDGKNFNVFPAVFALSVGCVVFVLCLCWLC